MDVDGFAQVVDGNGNPVYGLPNTAFVVTHAHATAALASKAAVAKTHHVLTGFVVSSDLDGAVCTLKQDTTTLFQFTVKTAGSVSPVVASFPTPVVLAVNKTANLAINGTAACAGNLFGYSIKVK